MKSKLTFPLFNAFVGAIFGALIGYYVGRLLLSILLGGMGCLALGFILEAGLGRLSDNHWLYKRRVLLAILLEAPVAVFIFGPYAFVLVVKHLWTTVLISTRTYVYRLMKGLSWLAGMCRLLRRRERPLCCCTALMATGEAQPGTRAS